ncbi:GntR family transcriptional regulator [Methylococcaceae bacterium CS1]|nr:GntR family transcriptional regulator [Methyloprofundus sp.]TXK96848.1 GntR family transcriptional regulator [Methylococcaceae bacterium CS4]TXK98719.1 GntR family transcriptional regulator [Methylococcaceae bacterium CS5]TXL03797.1 GntR family transcriptional regulator [Methylococcaceae bacterium CS1]TXL06930.1 GntR family transcriptional regulator [Methylococcaceae bacterium CS2]TXL07345.1 GntR family transcriptional regulator [Methylococcaceae bacterium CS3]
MINIGQFNTLNITKDTGMQLYLDGGSHGDILLADKQAPKEAKIGEPLKVFIYTGSDGELLATRKRPLVKMDGVAWLKVVSTGAAGAFLDWGLTKDLLVPFSEQDYELEENRYCLVKVYLDSQNRIAASTYLNHYISDEARYLKEGDEVSLIIAGKTDLGFKAVINENFWGVLYHNEVFQPLKEGQKLKGYIKKIREDQKIDLSLNKTGYTHVTPVTEQIIQRLKDNNGFLELSDKSSPEAINAAFGVSKKVFKHAIGSLYKERRITLTKTSVSLNK